MNFKHFSIGAILIIIGVAILSPFDDLFVLIPLSTVFGPELIPLVMALGAICLAIGIFLVGKSTLVHMGWVGKTVAHHPVVILGVILVICFFVYWWLTGMG